MKRPRRPRGASHGARALRSFVAVRDILHASLSAGEPSELYEFALSRIGPLVDATFASVYLRDGAAEMLRIAGSYNWPERFRPRLGELRVRLPHGPSGQAAAERRMVRVEDVHASPEHADWHEIARELGFDSLVALPLLANGNVLGVVTFYFAEDVRPGTDALELMQVAADQLAAYAEKTQLAEALRRAQLAVRESDRDAEPSPASHDPAAQSAAVPAE